MINFAMGYEALHKVMNNYKRIAIKIGSNVLARRDGTLDITRMSAIVDQVAELRRSGKEVVIITSGAVASGRSEMKDTPRLDAVSARQLFSAVGQAKLINRYYEFFRDHGMVCGQVLTMKENFSTRLHYLNQKHCMEVMLDNGVIPIVNENDTVSVTELMFTDNDELSGLIATMMDMDVLIILSNIDGVYDGDPSLPESKLIPEVLPDEALDAETIVARGKSQFGRGGMGTKFRIARKVADEGIAVMIANGKRENVLTDILLAGKEVPHTTFVAQRRAVSSVKKWIAHSDGFAKGEIHINQGAYVALTSTAQASSLLAVGVTRVDGEFEKDDIVKIVAPDGRVFAVGRTSYDSEEARKLIGVQGAKPIVHYNYLFIDQ